MAQLQGRGMLTDKVKEKATELLGREIDTTELRMMPYLQYQMMNEQRIDPRRCSSHDRKVLSLWRKDGHIEGGASGLTITKGFWDIINEILFLAYVNIDY